MTHSTRNRCESTRFRHHSLKRPLLPTNAVLLFLTLLLATSCANGGSGTPVEVLGEQPHDPRAFTEGLLIDHGILFESTGQYGASEVRRVDLATGRVEARYRLPKRYFGEGLARIGDRLYQLTWKSGTGFVYDADRLRVLDQFDYEGQGWGLSRWQDQLVMSNGSAELQFIDPKTFNTVRRLRVTEQGHSVSHLNELEVIGDEIWANVWLTDRIIRIDPASGAVLGRLDAGALAARMPESADVLNGIAYDAEHDRIYITGKYWPRLFQIARPRGEGP
ncbi:glutaminyl-peptide cyclotransferase [Salinisphaera sp. SPP-AMP-43]|uniref:glutaminyl-peptide cyclotransferase n=1 Tax=Salinisphaera sp. SPP-AMP-43 TaxID=3121288 RepID=UPI003C6E3DF6